MPVVKLQTTGGTTGQPSLHFLTRPLDDVRPTKMEAKFVGFTWSKIYRHSPKESKVCDPSPSPKGWYIAGGTPIRKFNTFFLTQHEESLRDMFFA
jgi:hypothetical protein